MSFRFLLAPLLFLLASAAPKSYTLNLVDANVIPDGFTRQAVTVDGSFAPLLTAQKDDIFQITVNNHLTNSTMLKSTSIHWHGLFQHRTAAMDGVAFVTQCPITPNTSFVYQFATAGQTGTYWYHSHYSLQYCDGLRGPIVVYDPNDPQNGLYDVDDASTVITIADWYHIPAQLNFNPKTGFPPTPSSHLINGRGRGDSTSTAPLSVITVQSGKRYRLRFVSMSCDPNYIVTVEGHNLTMIEADGVAHHPVTINSFQIFAGQRYSAIITADQPVGNYWIRTLPSSGPTSFLNGMNSAILRYQGAPVNEPSSTTQNIGSTLSESDLHPLVNPGAPGGSASPDVAFNLAIAFQNARFFINGATFVPPTVPVLLQILSGASTASQLLPSGSVFVLPPNKTIEISIPGGTIGSPHAFHLHGHNFDVIRSAGQTGYNYVDPPRRDVVSTGPSTSDNVTIRFHTDNPGPWFLHCHVEWHLQTGLAIVFAEDPTSQQSGPDSEIHNAAWDNLCNAWNNQPPGDQ
ncbi:laccase 1 [Cantharellus anzutake]|uniref:laccase 1 n=1 Tax=Cantharellus anzutake TaxID=1750568 RepID=UPI0019039E36|nr:laccase 1 [Cantharellus anzutake]KAF8334083.1 laccase 1 [Cantharellus anzutake]